MVKIAYKYYFKFPPFVRKSIDFSLLSAMNVMMVEYYSPRVENILLGCDDIINEGINRIK